MGLVNRQTERDRMKKLIVGLFAVLALMLGASVPAHASVPDWDLKTVAALQVQGYSVKTPAEWNSIKTVLDSPEDLAYARNLPASPLAMQRKALNDCPLRPPAGTTEQFCLWNGYSFTGTMWNLPKSWLGDNDPNHVNDINGLSFYGSGINNTSKGWFNSTYYTVRLFDRDACFNGTFYRDMTGNQYAYSVDASSNDWENRFSSIAISVYSNTYCYSTPGQ